MEKRKKKNKGKRKRLTLAQIMRAELPAAIMSRITPLFGLGVAALAMTVIVLFLPMVRSTAPLFAILGIFMAGYAVWQKADVIKRGYDEHVFKVIDYTYMMPVITKKTNPTGMLLLNKDEEDDEAGNVYHVSTSGKNGNLPPIDWLIRVYVPKGSVAAQYGDRKYFPIVYGYKIEGEDKPKG